MLTDLRGVPVSHATGSALSQYERALREFQTYMGDPIATLDGLIEAHPAFVSAHLTKALLQLTLMERRFAGDALGTLATANKYMHHATDRELKLSAAVSLIARGDWHEGTTALDRVLIEYPTDIVTLQAAHLMDFFRGDSLNLRNRISRVLPHWSHNMPGYAYVLGMHAFGLEECNQYSKAEATGREAVALAPDDCWAVHAVAHVMEMQGRAQEGIEWYVNTQREWAAEGNGFAYHNWWHTALFHMDAGRFVAALEVYDRHLSAIPMDLAMGLVDSTALLWRIKLEGADVGQRFHTLADVWERKLDQEAGFYAFNDFHAALAFAASGRRDVLHALRVKLDRAAERNDANAAMTLTVGAPLVDALIAYCNEQHGVATDLLMDVRDGAHRFGGSHAQRDLLTLTLIDAARHAGRHRVAQHYLNERLVHKPASAWGPRIAARMKANAVSA